MPKKTPWKYGLDSSTVLQEKLLHAYGHEYLLQRIHIMQIQRGIHKTLTPLGARTSGYPISNNQWRSSYHYGTHPAVLFRRHHPK